MALSANTVWEVRTAGNDANGGGFVTGASGSDWSQQDSKRTGADVTDISTTDLVATGVATVTSATANFATTIVGNIICLSGGTGSLTKGWYQVTTRNSATSIILDRIVAAGTGITLNIGGALASPGMVGGATLVAGHYIWIKAGTYTITSASTNISGGCFSSSTAVFMEGYSSTRGDMGTKPLLQADGVITTFTIIAQAASGLQYIKNIKVDGNNRTSSRGFLLRGHAMYCEAINCTNSAFADTVGTVESTVINSLATGCSTQPVYSGVNCIGCVAHTNTITGFTNNSIDCQFHRCIAYGNSGASSDGFIVAAATGKALFSNCVAYDNGRNGFTLGGQRGQICINCIAQDNAGTGFIHSLNLSLGLFNCAAYSNTTADFNIGTAYSSFNTGSITGSGSFFTNAASGDFSLNNTGGAGAAVRAAGIYGVFPGGLTTGYLDIGAAQHQDTGGGGGGGEHSAVF